MHLIQDGDSSGLFEQIARLHDRSRFEVRFATLGPLTPEFRDQLAACEIGVTSLGALSRKSYPLAFARLLFLLIRWQPDILHTHLFDPSVVGLPAGLFAGIRVRVMTRHYSDYHTRINKRWHVRLDQLCTRLCACVIAVSHQTKQVMVEEEGAPKEKVRVVHNGIAFSRVEPPTEQEIGLVRRELDLIDRPVVTIVARLHPEKGHEFLFRAFPAILEATGGRARLLVAGKGPFLTLYQRQVQDLGIADAVRFLGFRLDVIRIMAASDVVVLPSVAEAFGLAITEAMALRKPVIGTRAGGIPEIIVDGETGILVPPRSPEALAEAILSLLGNPKRCAALGEAGRRRVERYFRFEVMMKGYEDIYDEFTAVNKARH